ncbi:MAG: N-succinylarginine dihydrolase [Verrucomicrobiales bacterium]|nr:N-succinylarginine dihydrolase [Verrucomicrobiales bacterium]
MKEVNFDGLVSPTHNYSGLATGNLASKRSSGSVSRPRDAALQGLAKMRTLAERGVSQAFFPPQLRPSIVALRRIGFSGSDSDVLSTAFATSPGLFAACSSASSMWTANAAIVAPSIDSRDSRVHFTPANLVTNYHRSIEVDETASLLRAIFHDTDHFVHHQPLPATAAFADEGAANHTRLAGLHLFVYGRSDGDRDEGPVRFPARQTLEACQAIARLHQLAAEKVFYLRQNPEAIDAGVFHNDVISVGNENVFLYHEKAFCDQAQVLADIVAAAGETIHWVAVPEEKVSLRDAVDTYLFNSQIVTLPAGGMLLLCPSECRDHDGVHEFITEYIVGGENPIEEVVFQDLRQSMRNGGGPACLRLRVLLTEEEIEALPPKVFFTSGTDAFLRNWIDRVYPEELTLEDLCQYDRYLANAKALEELHHWIQV